MASDGGTGGGRRAPLLRGAGAVLGSALSNHVGAALGAHAFASLGLPGLQAPAVPTALCVLAYLPVLVLLAASGRLGGAPLGYAVTAEVLASVVPYAVDLMALRVVPSGCSGSS
ncbi:hypothetical protein [Geodermatophilus sp. URMC 64]